jgi:hypothetical protein
MSKPMSLIWTIAAIIGFIVVALFLYHKVVLGG